MCTSTHPDLAKIYKHTYVGKRKTITKEWLDNLSLASLAYLYQDDGTFSSFSNITLATYNFTKEENQLLSDFLKDKFGFITKVHIYKTSYKGMPRRYAYIRFQAESGRDFLKKIKPYIHKSMEYKLGPEINCPLCGAKHEYGKKFNKFEEVI